MKLKILIYILLPLLVAVGSAKDYSSTLSISEKEVSVNQCGIATYDLVLRNSGEKEDTFYVLVEGIPEGWYAVSHETITLKPNESKNVYLFVTANCFEEPKNYMGKISFLGNSETFANFKMNVVADHKIDIIIPENISSCVCEDKSFIAIIQNSGKYDEEIKLSAVGVKIKDEKIKLKAGERAQVEVTIDKLCDIKAGKYVAEIVAESTSSYAKSRKIVEINRENCYDFELSYPKEVRSCVDEKIKFSIGVKNTGIKSDEYTLIIDAINASQRIEVKPNETKMFDVNFSSEEQGLIDIGFTVLSKSKQEKGSIRFIVEKCFGVDLQPESNEIYIKLGEGKMLKAKIVNTGSKADNYQIYSDINWVSIRPENVSLNGSGSDDVFIYYSPEYGMKGKFETKLVAESKNSIDVENITINVFEPSSIEPVDEGNASATETTTTAEIKEEGNLAKNKTLIALAIGIVVTLVVFGLIYLFVMRE